MQVRPLYFLVALCAASEAQAQELRCDISQKYVCEAVGCRTIPATMWNIINPTKGTYARCDAKSCDSHRAQFSEAGAFINIQIGPSTIAKIATTDVPMFELKAIPFHEVT